MCEGILECVTTRYIPRLSEESELLRRLTESDSEFKWGEKQVFLKLRT